MSIYSTTSPKHCAAKQTIPLHHLKTLNKKLLFTLSSLLLSLTFLSLLFFLILHPSKPRFHLHDTALYDLTLTSPPSPRLLNSTIQATIVSNNPNTHSGVYYDRLRAYAVYKGQQITAEAELPPFYQGNGDTNLLSASLVGAGMPMATGLGDEVVRDRMNGKMVLSVRLDGEMRWKVGSWVSRRYRFDVDCVAVIRYGVAAAGGGLMAGVLGEAEGTECSANV
ncbi:NDR1/HIN1-like protein 1 [Phalaenopsis equestris]|uniref:NDR1/HIN1-like protein 1 n=1 Tax=Phalaenopsis equestris TaxID=78828 RepID=UPI0009E55D6E|nr:NDR1/HIN1-like protein 1 [Phalaenopsis equestris]